jgi:hypothetical protein
MRHRACSARQFRTRGFQKAAWHSPAGLDRCLGFRPRGECEQTSEVAQREGCATACRRRRRWWLRHLPVTSRCGWSGIYRPHLGRLLGCCGFRLALTRGAQ